MSIVKVIDEGRYLAIDIRHSNGYYYAFPAHSFSWNARGYWCIQKMSTDRKGTNSSSRKEQTTSTKSTLFAVNGTWNAEFLLAGRKYMRDLGDANEEWTEIDDNIPFRVYDRLHEEFIIQPARNFSQSQTPKKHLHIPNLPETEDDVTFFITEMHSDIQQHQRHQSHIDVDTDQSIPIDNKTIPTSDGIVVSVPPELTYNPSLAQWHQNGRSISSSSSRWRIVREKSEFVLHTLERPHPFTDPLFVEKHRQLINTRKSARPRYTLPYFEASLNKDSFNQRRHTRRNSNMSSLGSMFSDSSRTMLSVRQYVIE